jgi:hypothetical protein
MSKGSAPRPFSVSNDEYAKRWDAIFQRDLKEPEVTQEEDEAFQQLEQKNKDKANEK